MATPRSRSTEQPEGAAPEPLPTPPPAELAPAVVPTTPADGKLTPREWAHRKGLLFEPSPKQPWVEPHAKGFYYEAATLHGWTQHAHDHQTPEQAFRLTEADFDAALAAAGEFPAVPAHEPALAPGCPKPVVPEQIAKACAEARAKAAQPTGA